MLGTPRTDEARLRWVAGAGLIVFLLIDAYALLTAGGMLYSDFGWFILGFLTASFMAAAALTQPRRRATVPAKSG